jgi:sigma-B regulation protein RsbU (phosphoserine phosphatase)
MRGFAKLNAGDLLCLYTDGIVEAHNADDEEFTLERLEALVAANRHRTSEEIGREVLARVKEWGPGEQDDRTVVIVKAVNP